MDQFRKRLRIDLAAESCDMDVNDIVERGSARCFLPDIPREGIAHHNLAFVTHQIFQQLELSSRQLYHSAAASHSSSHDIEIQIGHTKTKHVCSAAAPKQCADSG